MGLKTQLCDMLVQKSFEGRASIDWPRFGAFAAFGLVYLGGVQYVVYNRLMPALFPRVVPFA